MITESLQKLAQEAGISCEWTDAHGNLASLDESTLRGVLAALDLPAETDSQIRDSLVQTRQFRQEADDGPLLICDAQQPIDLRGRLAAGSRCDIVLEDGQQQSLQVDAGGCLPALPCGYHQLQCGEQQLLLACAPHAALSVAELTGNDQPIWGLSAQVYSLRRTGDGGLGDTAALEYLALAAAHKGAAALAISPLHAMFSARPEQYSPYSPSSRSLFNILHAAPAQVLGVDAVERAIHECGLQFDLQTMEQSELIDWPAVSALRLRLLRQLHTDFSQAPDRLQADFHQFRTAGGARLEQHCCHEALQQHRLDQDLSGDWREWPTTLRDPNSPQVAEFARQHAPELDFQAFCQWLIDRCLGHVQSQCRDAGMAIGLIADMAVGADPSGSFGWSHQQELLNQVSIGAPPDLLSRDGQNWGVAAFSPLGLKRSGYHAFIEMLRANLAHAGGIRIDHIMGLQRLWIIPEGANAQDGAYLNYPLDDFLRLLALESWRHRALIIGEDLGTVPEGLQDALAERNILGMRVLLFEQQNDELPAPAQWSDRALATTTTHDLPTLTGWQSGRDIAWREHVGQSSVEQAELDRQHRSEEVQVLREALQREGLLGTEKDPQAQLDASIRFLGRTPAPLVLIPLEDILGATEQPNLPGPGDMHPNWRRRWLQPAAQMLDAPAPVRRLQYLHEARLAHKRNARHG
ncbi:4-alpha-glucanotransferase [Halopseudomonas litoralis]|uniref:4-alpha-glucanotransferase n=1 Tax=Halopseudomonas litoralis TaxID=797277 RepID=A0A1H1T724_9GAMM|nr:4-alpha-glucanotransferase [Halopseudomonas litoralis]SDS55997.1 4-alpha-glucanotransferase [Halopseudomonas litoralis]